MNTKAKSKTFQNNGKVSYLFQFSFFVTMNETKQKNRKSHGILVFMSTDGIYYCLFIMTTSIQKRLR